MNTLISETVFGVLGLVAFAMMIELLAKSYAQQTLNIDGTLESNQFLFPLLDLKWLNKLVKPIRNRTRSTLQYFAQVDASWIRIVALENQMSELLHQRDQLAALVQHLKLNQYSILESKKTDEIHRLKAGVAHELNNALNILGGVVEPLQNDFYQLKSMLKNDDGFLIIKEVELLLSELSKSTVRAKDSASNFIDLIPDNRLKPEETLYESLQSKLYWLRLSYPEIKFIFHIEKSLRFYKNDPELLLIINNLLVNAIEAVFSTLRPEIELSVELMNGNELSVTVSDNGVGIQAEHHSKVFEPFYTVNKSENAAGLGLFVVAGLVERKNGTVDLTSNPYKEEGATVKVNLPLGLK